jgi:hypothetical protein
LTPADTDPWIDPAPLLTVTYLPDPQARGVAFMGLPGEVSADTVRTITFADTWPDLRAFRIELKPAAGPAPAAPSFAGDTLTVELAPAQRATVRINSFLDPADLESRGVWQWTDELGPPNLAQVKTSLLAGRHWAHLPWRELTLVYAVQKPLEAPKITLIDPKKTLGETFAGVTGDINVNAPSTARVQLLATWTDPVDDPPDPPTSRNQNAHVCEIEVPEGVSPVAIKDSATKQTPKQEFHDTKYHRVWYTPVAVTRFREYFPAITNTPAATTETGTAVDAHVLNSARPEMPKLLYAVPVFEWSTPPGSAGVIKRRRSGGGLRIYLDRPWFSSGDGELLGIVFKEGVDVLKLDDHLRRSVTFWGADPIWDANPIAARVEKAHFKHAVDSHSGPLLPDSSEIVTVVGYTVDYDPVRKLRFADIQIEAGDTYWPFVRLALSRFQPKSVDGAYISPVVRADFIAVPPARQAEIVINPGSVHLKVNGPVYFQSEVTETIGRQLLAFGGSPQSTGLSEIEAVIEERDPADDPANELNWKPIEATRTTLFQNPALPGEWEGDVPLTGPLSSGLFRLTLKELEWFRTDDADSQEPPRDKIRVAKRVVYADAFAL